MIPPMPKFTNTPPKHAPPHPAHPSLLCIQRKLALIRSSSTPPAVVTSTSTRRCCTRKRMCSRTPADTKLDVYPRKILQRTEARSAGSGTGSSSTRGSLLSRQASWTYAWGVAAGGRAGRRGGVYVVGGWPNRQASSVHSRAVGLQLAAHHAVDLVDGLPQRAGLKASGKHRGQESVQVAPLVEVIPMDLHRILWQPL